MAIRYKALTELYQETQRKVTAPAEWQQFLTSACRNYRLSFDEQLLVYAQRPDATAVLEIERWNKRFGRWVNRGANGIAVFDGEHSGKQRLKYYFDVSDTHEGRFSRPVPLWTVRSEYAPDIIEALENSFGELEQKDNLGAALLSAAKNAVEDNIHDYLSELSHLTEGSFLEELDEYNVEVMYRRALQTSIGYMLVVRCGLDPSEYFEDDDFRDVLNFNTPETLNALGVAAGDISQMCLSEIARTTLALQRQPQKENRTFETAQENQYPVTEQKIKQPERSVEYDRDHIQQTGQLQPAESSAPAGAGSGSWEIRITSPEVPEGESQDHLHQSADQRQAERPSGRDRADGTLPDGSDGGADGQNRGRDGGTESPRSDEVGATHEQPSERSGGNDPHGADLQLSDTEQADSQELPAFLDEAQIMAVIANKDDNLKYKKQQIELFFSVHTDQRERADYLKSAYQDRYTEIIADGQRLGYKPQEDGLLMWEGSYLSRTKESVFSWDLVARWTAQLIEKKEYFIQTDIRQLPTQESQQMSLFDFPSFGSSTPSEGEPQRSLFSRPALSQQVIDEALCIGANDQNSRLIICAYFKKDKPLEDNTRSLMEHYGENGAGFYLDSRKYSIWYNAEGIHMAEGETAQRTAATLIPWEQAARRIRELLDLGRYMPQSELDRVDGYERQQRAAQLWYLRQDFAEGTADAGFLPTINAIYNTHQGFPDESAAISELLGHPEGLQNLRDELEQFVQAYGENRELLRFHFHRPQKLLEQLADLQREPLHFTAAEGYDPQRRFFISGDEIDNLLRGGKRSTDYRLAVYSLNQVYALEELVHRKYPAEITRLTERIAGYEKDVELAKAHPKAQEGFCGMEVEDKHYAEKEDAGKAIIDVCTKMTGSDAVLLGQYRGFSMVLAYDGMSNEYRITLKGTLSHTVTLGADVFGNITRLDNALENLAGNLDAERAKLEEAKVQLENARTELATPFAREDELTEKTARLKELNILLNMDEKDKTLIDEAPDEGEEPPVRKVVGLER